MAATLKEVARQAGVSIRTVSRVLKGAESVSDETRRKVMSVAGDLGYRPSLLARALVTRRSRTLGLVIPHLTNPYFAEVVQGVFDTAHLSGYHVLMNHCNWNTEPAQESWQALADHAVEGLITDLHYGQEASILAFASTLNPIVVLMKTIAHPGISSVLVDIELGARKALEYLVRKGHRQIALLVVHVPNPENVERIRAYRKVMAENGLPEIIQYLPVGWTKPDVPTGQQAALSLLENHPEVTAIFCYNDLLAIGALQACKQTGRAVPADCAVIGFDDIPFAALVYPSLSTVRVDKYGLGRQAVARLLTMIGSPGLVFEPCVLETDLVLRESA